MLPNINTTGLTIQFLSRLLSSHEADQIKDAEMYETRLKAVSFLKYEGQAEQAPYEPILKSSTTNYQLKLLQSQDLMPRAVLALNFVMENLVLGGKLKNFNHLLNANY